MSEPSLQRLSLEIDTSPEFKWVNERLDKLNREINHVNRVKMIITDSNS